MKKTPPADPELAMAVRLEARLVRLVTELTTASPRVQRILAPAVENAVTRLRRAAA